MNRKELLKNLLHFNLPLEEIKKNLATYEWDSAELVTLTKADLIAILRKYIDGIISETSLETWANAIEGRDDIAYDEQDRQLLTEIIFTLANPDITIELTKKYADELINKLSQK